MSRTVSSAADGGRDTADPWMVIDAAHARKTIDLAELWHYRDLLYFLTRRDVAVRYKQTVLGFLWAIIQPLMSMVVFTVFLGTLAGVPSDGIPYPVFSYLGLLLWTYFAGRRHPQRGEPGRQCPSPDAGVLPPRARAAQRDPGRLRRLRHRLRSCSAA